MEDRGPFHITLNLSIIDSVCLCVFCLDINLDILHHTFNGPQRSITRQGRSGIIIDIHRNIVSR